MFPGILWSFISSSNMYEIEYLFSVGANSHLLLEGGAAPKDQCYILESKVF